MGFLSKDVGIDLKEELRKLQNRHRPSARKENQPQPSLFDLGL